VSQTGVNSASAEAVQVTLAAPPNSPIPIGLVSVVTLTRLGDLGEAGAVDQAAFDPGVLGAVGPLPLPALLAQVGLVHGGDPAPEAVAEWKAPPPARGGEVPLAGDAPGSELVAAQAPPDALASVGDGASPAGNPDAVEVGSLLGADGRWCSALAVLGAVTLYVRRRARKATTTTGAGVDARPNPGLFRRWGRSTSRKSSGGVHSPQTPHATAPRSNPCPMPRHLSNP
jgi:hypothetical protein